MFKSLVGTFLGQDVTETRRMTQSLYYAPKPLIKSTNELLTTYFREKSQRDEEVLEFNLDAILCSKAESLAPEFKLNMSSVIRWLDENANGIQAWVTPRLLSATESNSNKPPSCQEALYIIAKLDLSNFEINAKNAEALMNFLKKNTTVTELSLYNTGLTNETLPLIEAIFELNRTIKNIDLRNNNFTDEFTQNYLIMLSARNKVSIKFHYNGQDFTTSAENKSVQSERQNNAPLIQENLVVNRNSPQVERKEIERNAILNNTFQLIAESDSRIAEMMTNITAKEILIIWGLTKTGKTTLALMLSKLIQESRVQLEVFRGDDLNDLKIRDIYTNNGETPKISTKYCSETKFPNKFEASKEVTIFDCPGTLDTDGVEHEIANMFFISKIFDTKKPCKFIITVAYSSVASSLQKDLIATLNHFIKMFAMGTEEECLRNIETMTHGIALVVTHVDPQIKIENVEKVFAGIIRDGIRIDDRVKCILTNLKDHIYLFHKPTEVGVIKEPELKSADFDNQPAIIPVLKARIAINDEYKNIPNELLAQVNKNIGVITKVITDFFRNNLSNIDVHSALNTEIFSKNYKFMKACLPLSKWYHAKLDSLDNAANLLALQEISELRDIFHLNRCALENNLKTLINVFKVIEKFSREEFVKKQIKDYAHVLEQQIGYKAFLEKLSELHVHVHGKIDPLKTTIDIASASIASAFFPVIELIKLKDNQLIGYYEEALIWLRQHNNPTLVTNTLAKVHQNIASIYDKEGEYPSAMWHYIEALKYRKIPDIYENIGDLFCELGRYADAIRYYKVANQALKIEECLMHGKQKVNQGVIGGYEAYCLAGDYYAEIGVMDQAFLNYQYAKSFAKAGDPKHRALCSKMLEVPGKFNLAQQKLQKQMEQGEFYDYSHASEQHWIKDMALVSSLVPNNPYPNTLLPKSNPIPRQVPDPEEFDNRVYLGGEELHTEPTIN